MTLENSDTPNHATGSTCTYRFIPSVPANPCKERRHHVTIRQQPQIAKMSIVNERDRRPIEPAPILQLQWLNCSSDAIKEYLQSPFYFMVINLVYASHPEVLLVPVQEYLSGSTVSSLHRLRDIDNTDGGFFVFGDLAVKREGKFKLHFSLYEITETSVHNRATLFSDEFTVYIPRKYPGPLEATFLSRMFSDQGIKMRLRKEHRLSSASARKRKLGKADNPPPVSTKARLFPEQHTTASGSRMTDDSQSEQDTSSSTTSAMEEPDMSAKTDSGRQGYPSRNTLREDPIRLQPSPSVSDTVYHYGQEGLPLRSLQPTLSTPMPSQTATTWRSNHDLFSNSASDGKNSLPNMFSATLPSPASQTPSRSMSLSEADTSMVHSREEQRVGRSLLDVGPTGHIIPPLSLGNPVFSHSRPLEPHPSLSGPSAAHSIPSPPQSTVAHGHIHSRMIHHTFSTKHHLATQPFDHDSLHSHSHAAGQMTPPVLADILSPKDSHLTWGERLPPLKSIMCPADLPWQGDKTLPSPVTHVSHSHSDKYNDPNRPGTAIPVRDHRPYSDHHPMDHDNQYHHHRRLDIQQLISQPTTTPSLPHLLNHPMNSSGFA